MPNRHVKPSSYLPSYLRLDLNVGVESENPFISALDETFERWCQAAQCESLSMTRTHFPSPKKRVMTEGYGFRLDTLCESEVDSMYQSLGSLFHSHGSLSAVKLLADIYFLDQVSSLRRGRPFDRKPLKGGMKFPLEIIDRDDDSRTVMVGLLSAPIAARAEEFLHNVERVIPAGFRVTLKFPGKSPERDESKFDIGHPTRIDSRRL